MLGIKDMWYPTIKELERIQIYGWCVVIENGLVVSYEWEV